MSAVQIDGSLDFTTARREVLLTLDGEAFAIREFGGEESERLQDLAADKIVLGPDGKPVSVKGAAAFASSVLVAALYQKDDTGQYQTVTKEWVNTLPASLIRRLTEIAFQVNGMGKEGDAEAKKASSLEPADTGSGSPKPSDAEPSAS